MDIVETAWTNFTIRGSPGFILWQKLKMLRPVLRSMHNKYNNVGEKITLGRSNLEEAQKRLRCNKFDSSLMANECNCRDELYKWLRVEEKILAQRSKLSWLKLGDGNNAYFHSTVREKNKSTGLHKLQTPGGDILTNQSDIEDGVLNFYRDLVGEKRSITGLNIPALRKGRRLTSEHCQILIAPVTEEEINVALRNLGDNKAPGVDGYSPKFFKTTWNIVGQDVRKVIQDFFGNMRLSQALNSTLVTLIPKRPDATQMTDMRPISCCTTVYKIISKILTARMGMVISSIVDLSQSAFVPGRSIQDNILLAYELIRGYGRKHCSPRCMIQLDLQKAFDSVEWAALEGILRELGFPRTFIN